MKKETIIQIIIIVLLAIILGLLVNLTLNQMTPNNRAQIGEFDKTPPQEETVEKETKAENVEVGTIVEEEIIDLNGYSSNVTISKAGNYTLTGEFDKSVLVNADGAVTLNLNNVTIKNNVTSAIANISKHNLTINLLEDTINILSDGGSSEYDGCIYSEGALIIEGNGELNVYGNQEEGEGIATDTNDITINGGNITIECQDDGLNAGGDNGGTITINNGKIYIKANGDGIDSNKNLIINGGELYTMGSSIGGDAGIDTETGFSINGGTIIALGSDMLQSPDENSTQKSACFNLNSKISAGATISLKNEKSEEIISFEVDEDFRTLIVSNDKIEIGTYYLYQNGEKTNYTVTVK